MVAFDDKHEDGSNEEQDCGTCPRCRFIERVTNYVQSAAEDGAEEWQDDVGPWIDKMHSALWALQRLWAEEQTNYSDEIDNAGEAARSLVNLFERLYALMRDADDDDPGAGL
jgi:hypothetical protein